MVHPVSTPSNINTQPTKFSSPMTNHSSAIKRKDPKVVSNAPPAAKRSRSKLSLPEKGKNVCSLVYNFLSLMLPVFFISTS